MIILLTEIEIQTLADEADENADQQIQCPGEYHPDWHSVRDSLFARAIQLALIEKIRKEPEIRLNRKHDLFEYEKDFDARNYHMPELWEPLYRLPTPQELEES